MEENDKIVATPEHAADVINEAITKELGVQFKFRPELRALIINALYTLPTLRDGLLKYELTGEDGSYPFTGADEGYINAVTSRIDSYLTDKTTDTTHSKQG